MLDVSRNGTTSPDTGENVLGVTYGIPNSTDLSAAFQDLQEHEDGGVELLPRQAELMSEFRTSARTDCTASQSPLPDDDDSSQEGSGREEMPATPSTMTGFEQLLTLFPEPAKSLIRICTPIYQQLRDFPMDSGLYSTKLSVHDDGKVEIILNKTRFNLCNRPDVGCWDKPVKLGFFELMNSKLYLESNVLEVSGKKAHHLKLISTEQNEPVFFSFDVAKEEVETAKPTTEETAEPATRGSGKWEVGLSNLQPAGFEVMANHFGHQILCAMLAFGNVQLVFGACNTQSMKIERFKLLQEGEYFKFVLGERTYWASKNLIPKGHFFDWTMVSEHVCGTWRVKIYAEYSTMYKCSVLCVFVDDGKNGMIFYELPCSDFNRRTITSPSSLVSVYQPAKDAVSSHIISVINILRQYAPKDFLEICFGVFILCTSSILSVLAILAWYSFNSRLASRFY